MGSKGVPFVPQIQTCKKEATQICSYREEKKRNERRVQNGSKRVHEDTLQIKYSTSDDDELEHLKPQFEIAHWWRYWSHSLQWCFETLSTYKLPKRCAVTNTPVLAELEHLHLGFLIFFLRISHTTFHTCWSDHLEFLVWTQVVFPSPYT